MTLLLPPFKPKLDMPEEELPLGLGCHHGVVGLLRDALVDILAAVGLEDDGELLGTIIVMDAIDQARINQGQIHQPPPKYLIKVRKLSSAATWVSIPTHQVVSRISDQSTPCSPRPLPRITTSSYLSMSMMACSRAARTVSIFWFFSGMTCPTKAGPP